MIIHVRSICRTCPLVFFAVALLTSGVTALSQISSQTSTCPAVAAHRTSPAEAAYALHHYARAEDLYTQALAQAPNDLQLSAALIRTMLREGDVSRAASKIDKLVEQEPHSAVVLTAQADLQLSRGEPWLAINTVKAALTADPCYAYAHLLRSRLLRIDSMYASEREEIQTAYDIDPADPDIHHAWGSIVVPAKDIQSIYESLATTKDLDPDIRQKALDSAHSMLPLLSENSETCQILPTDASVTLPLQPTFEDYKHIGGYVLDAQFAASKARLQVDTAASGIFISRAFADQMGLQPGANAPPGTVHADSVRIGPLEFRDCMIGVSETPFAGKINGFIGTDMFASWMITLDHPHAKLVLAPLPAQESLVPGDRSTSTELQGFTPVYHRHQYLLVPVLLSNQSRKLFILDTGIRLSTMREDVAHSVSKTRVNFTNAVQTTSGATLQIYRDSFDFQLANLTLDHQSHILEFEPTAVDQNTGFQVAGMLGFDMLHSMVMHLDYRDGLVKLESVDSGISTETLTASAAIGNGADPNACPPDDTRDIPIASTIEGKVTGLLESGRLKPGKQFTVTSVNSWSDPECSLDAGAILYGHVTSGAASPSEMSLVFDHADCNGHQKKEISLRIIGLVAPPDEFVGLHSVLPSEVAGGGRAISSAAASLASFAMSDDNLNPTGPPHTVHPGVVAGYANLKLQPLAGPGCSTKITSTDHNLRIGVGSQLILTRQSAH